MITAKDAHAQTIASIDKAHETRIFKRAMAKLEQDIQDASKRGKNEICYNICYFDIRPFSSLENDEYATEADRKAIKKYMEDHGYEFFYHSVMNIRGKLNSCFTCRW